MMAVIALQFSLMSLISAQSAHAATPTGKSKIRVACLGASITFGAGLPDREKTCYPAQMQQILGKHYEVRNFGVSGCTLLKHGDAPYWNTSVFEQAKAFQPDVVVIDLGGNDSKPQNWKFNDEFAADARALLDAFRTLPEKPRVLFCLPMPAFQMTFGINDSVIVNEEIPLLRQIAFETGTELIDLHTSFTGKQAWFADNIHPNAEGAAYMAKIIGEVIGFKADAGFDLEKSLCAQGITPTVSSFYGYRQLVFPMDGGRHCTVVRPYVTAARHPYAWRGEFFGHEPQTDLALLARGYHVVYVDAQDMYGASPAMAIWEQAHHLLAKAGLNGKIVLIGMSRGGLYCYHWAARHPETVAVLYGDAPVCDFKSWPGGRLRTTATKGEWEGLLRCYGFKDEAEAFAYTKNPLDNLAPLAKAGIPIIHVVGEADTDVPVRENTDIVEKLYKEMGGTIQVIRKPDLGHHPHSLPNPELIVDFILQHTK
jgi:pimeloyl-ACP methyl ester carboxylesterase/lysophospholipase L1-like esterase